MFNLKTMLQRCALALTLAIGSAAALAGPTYHVNVNTTGYTGTGQMDFNFLALTGAAQAQATLSNFSGAFGTETDRFGDVSGAIPGMLMLGNTDGVNYLSQAVTLGGLFAFDISFAGDFMQGLGTDGSTFAVSLYNEDFSSYIGVMGSFAQFDLNPAASGLASIVVSDRNALASIVPVAAVPEPSELLLMLTGLGLMGVMLRRRPR